MAGETPSVSGGAAATSLREGGEKGQWYLSRRGRRFRPGYFFRQVVVVGCCGRLTDRQKAFCDEYLIDLNATQAALRAGYSPKGAQRMAVRNMQNPLVQEYLNERREARSKRTQITQDFVLGELMKIATANGTDFASVGKGNRVRLTPTEELPPEKRAAVASVKKGRDGMEIKTYDKLRALELLGKHLGMFDAKSGREEADALEKLDRLLEGIGDAAAE